MTASPSSDREIGFVVAITNVRVTVRLHDEFRSGVRSFPGGLAAVSQLGAYLLLPIGVGELAVGTVVTALENEQFEPDFRDGGVALELAKPRRVLKINLLGTLVSDRTEGSGAKLAFRKGITVYPTLETPVLIPTESELSAILCGADHWQEGDNGAGTLLVGKSPIYPRIDIRADYDDLLSRPLAVLGNTGAGKSWTVASILQRALPPLPELSQARFIILDLNGEYPSAFERNQPARHADRAYVDQTEFAIPLWALSLIEYVHLYQVLDARQTQLPTLERMVAFAREYASLGQEADAFFRRKGALIRCRNIGQKLFEFQDGSVSSRKIGEEYRKCVTAFQSAMHTLRNCLPNELQVPQALQSASDGLSQPAVETPDDWCQFMAQGDLNRIQLVREALSPFLGTVEASLRNLMPVGELSADSPHPFPEALLDSQKARDWVLVGSEGEADIRKNLPTLFLRIRRFLADPRWAVLRGSGFTGISQLVEALTGTDPNAGRVKIIDCSMIAPDVLPLFCGVIGRLLLDARRHARPADRHRQPWVLVLEEAHNYLRPYRQDEPPGQSLARESFERIAKEGRKFGLTLVVASQRPSDVSATVLSQCSNFVVHRIQNPDDLEYFKKVVPAGFREMLDQVPIMSAGEALFLGSSVNVPSRVNVLKPSPPPQSETPRPSVAWAEGAPAFDIGAACRNWLREALAAPNAAEAPEHIVPSVAEPAVDEHGDLN